MPKKPCAHPGCGRLIDVGQSYCQAHAVAEKRERGRAADQGRADRPSRKWYKRKAWCGPGGRRLTQLAKESLCVLCPADSRQVATIADHVIPHRDNYALFWFGQLQSLCKPCHDIKKQREERRAMSRADRRGEGG